jgi:hypothetical protein
MSRLILVAAAIIIASLIYGLTEAQGRADEPGGGKFVAAPEWCFVDRQAGALICNYASQTACTEANKSKRGVCVIGVIIREEES